MERIGDGCFDAAYGCGSRAGKGCLLLGMGFMGTLVAVYGLKDKDIRSDVVKSMLEDASELGKDSSRDLILISWSMFPEVREARRKIKDAAAYYKHYQGGRN